MAINIQITLVGDTPTTNELAQAFIRIANSFKDKVGPGKTLDAQLIAYINCLLISAGPEGLAHTIRKLQEDLPRLKKIHTDHHALRHAEAAGRA